MLNWGTVGLRPAIRHCGATARQGGMPEAYAGLMPEDKARLVAGMARTGKILALTGDGIHNAPALAPASRGIWARQVPTWPWKPRTSPTAHALGKIPGLARLAKRILRVIRIRRNFTFAVGLKALFAILAVFGVTSLEMVILADVGASLLVITNGMRLLRVPPPARPRRSGYGAGPGMMNISTLYPVTPPSRAAP